MRSIDQPLPWCVAEAAAGRARKIGATEHNRETRARVSPMLRPNPNHVQHRGSKCHLTRVEVTYRFIRQSETGKPHRHVRASLVGRS
jgi:hypothetical protein